MERALAVRAMCAMCMHRGQAARMGDNSLNPERWHMLMWRSLILQSVFVTCFAKEEALPTNSVRNDPSDPWDVYCGWAGRS